MGTIYISSTTAGELRQAELFSGLTRYEYNPQSQVVRPVQIEFCITLTQDCDLLQDFDRRIQGKNGSLDHCLFAEAQSADRVRSSIGGSDLWKPVSQNKNERFYLLSEVPSDDDQLKAGLPCLVIDFRTLFSLPTEDVYRQLQNDGIANRRSRLADLYREHLQLRMANFLSRVMLPEPHKYVSPAIQAG